MDECLFCKIVDRSVNASIVFEDEDFIAFLDKSPIFKGHVLLMPKKHVETLFDFDDNDLKDMMVNVRKVAEGVKKALECDGILLINNNVISQSVPHFHMHIIPRKKGQPLRGFMWPRTKYKDEKEEKDFAERIKKAIQSI